MLYVKTPRKCPTNEVCLNFGHMHFERIWQDTGLLCISRVEDLHGPCGISHSEVPTDWGGGALSPSACVLQSSFGENDVDGISPPPSFQIGKSASSLSGKRWFSLENSRRHCLTACSWYVRSYSCGMMPTTSCVFREDGRLPDHDPGHQLLVPRRPDRVPVDTRRHCQRDRAVRLHTAQL